MKRQEKKWILPQVYSNCTIDSWTDRQTDRQTGTDRQTTDEQTDRQTDRQTGTDRQTTDEQTDRQTNKETNGHPYTCIRFVAMTTPIKLSQPKVRLGPHTIPHAYKSQLL